MFAGQGLVPLIHVAAEIAAAPFAQELAFNHAISELVPTFGASNSSASHATELLWRHLETEQRKQTPGVTVDELTSLRDHLWFDEVPQPVAVADLPARYVQSLATWLARELHRGPMRDVEDSVRVRLAMRWLRLALPRDFFSQTNEGEVSVPIRNLLGHGFAESHLHLGGAFDFEHVWTNFLAMMSNPQKQIEWQLGVPFGDATRFLAAATCTATAFCWIDLAVRWVPERATLHRGHFEEWLFDDASRLGISRTSLIIADASIRALASGIPSRIDQAAVSLALGDLMRLRARSGLRSLPSSLPLRDARLQRLGLSLAALQAERFRVLFYRYVVQRPLTRGLQHFFRHFARLRPFKRSRKNPVIEALKVCGVNHGLRFLEIRVAPENDLGSQREAWQRLNTHIDEAEAVYPSTKVHVVCHFVRDRGGGQRKGAPGFAALDTIANPMNNMSGWRYATFHQQIRHQQYSIRSLLVSNETARRRIRAFDLCTDEAGIPTWTYADSITFLRYDDPDLVNLRYSPKMTVHAGEDFVDLLTGLRRIWEAIHYLRLREGDRLGHAIALGVDIDTWVKSVQVVTRRIEERMWDLVWAWSFLRRTQRTEELHLLASEAERQAYAMFEERVTIHELHAVYKYLHDGRTLDAIGYPNQLTRSDDLSREGIEPFHRLLVRYLRSPGVFLNGQKVKVYETERDAALLRHCQHALRQMVSKAGISIEVNVSSNLLIGNLLQKRAHPMWRFRSPEEPGVDDIGIALGSDDPITFATTLPEEFQLAYDLLVNDGTAPVDALEWLNRVRRHGLSCHFADSLNA